MTQNVLVRARIDEDVKKRAAAVLETMGLTISDACRILLTKVAKEEQFPFDFRTPNAETKKAIEELKSGRGRKYKTPSDMFKDLGLK